MGGELRGRSRMRRSEGAPQLLEATVNGWGLRGRRLAPSLPSALPAAPGAVSRQPPRCSRPGFNLPLPYIVGAARRGRAGSQLS